jgi:nucleoside transporter
MHRLIGPRLSVMMFLQFFIWGAWYTTVGNYMDRIDLDASIRWAYTVGPIAAIISPFFLGMVADRYFATERVLGVMHLLGGLALLAAPSLAAVSARSDSAAAEGAFIVGGHLPFIGILLVHMLCFMPTLGLTNTLAFHNIENQEKQFPMIRVFGTIGWIVAGILVSLVLHADTTPTPLYIAGGAALALGVYSFTLPHTPPPAAGRKATVSDVLGLDSLRLMKSLSFSVFIISSMLICVPLAAYYAFAQIFVKHVGFKDPAFIMTFGQMSEIIFMLVMPLFFARLGVKWMLFVGMLAWVARYNLFGAAAEDGVLWMVLVGIILHGICYDFFFVTGQIYVDKKAPTAIRGQAQGFLVLVTQGIGLGIGAQLTGKYYEELAAANAADLEKQAEALRTEELAAEAIDPDRWQQMIDAFLATHDWQTYWYLWAATAATVMVLFALLFWDRTAAKADQTEASEAYLETGSPNDPREKGHP